MEDNRHMDGKVKKLSKKNLFLFFLFLPVFFYSFAYGLEKKEVDTGSLALSLEKRLMEPFEIESYKVLLDGKIVLRNFINDKELYNATLDNIPEGNHKVLVKAVYSGSGYGIFDYHQNYKYPVKSETEVKIRAGRITNLKIIFNDNDGFLAELEKRPFISYETEQTTLTVTEMDRGADSGEIEKEDAKPGVKAGNIKKILVDKGIHLVKVHVVGDGFFEEVKTGRIDKPERIVIDISHVKELLDIDKVVVKSPLLDRVRVGQHPHMSRVVLDIPHKKKVDYNIEKTSLGLIVNVFDDKHKGKEFSKDELQGKYSWNLTDVYAEKRANRVEIHFSGEGTPGVYEGKRFEKPDRIVIDVKNARESIKVNKLEVNSPLLNSVRIGQHPEGLRLVMDIPVKATANYELKREKNGLLLVITERKANSSTSQKRMVPENSFGLLNELSVEKGSVEVEISMRGRGSFEKYKVNNYKKPNRIVIDLPDMKEGLETDEIDVESNLVKKVRVGYESGITRIVIDLQDEMDVGYDIVPHKGGLSMSVFKKE